MHSKCQAKLTPLIACLFFTIMHFRFDGSSKLRGDLTGMCEELMKEYNRLGRPLAGDEWLEPEVLVPLAKRWMLQHASRDDAGRIVMPGRVKHPGKMWIMTNASSEPSQADATPSSSLGHAAVPSEPVAPVQPQIQPATMDEFKIIYRKGVNRLLQVNWLGKRIGDVPLPPGSFKIMQYNGRQVLSAKGGAEIYDAEEYMATLMPSRSAAETATPGREQGSLD